MGYWETQTSQAKADGNPRATRDAPGTARPTCGGQLGVTISPMVFEPYPERRCPRTHHPFRVPGVLPNKDARDAILVTTV